MSGQARETVTVVVEREFPHPPEKLWRALTQPHLIEEWLMKNDFEPAVGHRFTLHADPQANWSGVIDCEVMTVEPNRVLAYSWGALGAGTVVTLTLTPTGTGTHLRVEQSGFSPDRPQNFNGARFGWQKFLANLEQLMARTD
ncbi:MAG: SRPBCC domain-containing protein [Rhizomicrobium sp.]|jgi:uncharacterized protein YndB with AHSA1/START domain